MFQYGILDEFLDDTVRILSFIIILLQVLGAIGLIIVGSSRIRKNGTIKNSVVFTIGGFILAIFLVLNERIYFLMVRLGGSEFLEDLGPIFYQLLIQMLPSVVSLTTFGALFLLLGIKNKQNYGKFLMLSGIFWIIFGTISILLNINYILGYIRMPHISGLSGFYLEYVRVIIPVFTVISSVFFLIYAIKIKVKTLLYSSIILLVASKLSAVTIILEFIMIYM